MPKIHERTNSRRTACQVLYSGAIRQKSALELLDNGEIMCLDSPLDDYAYKLVQGVESNKGHIDAKITSVSENWKLERMPLMDAAILRIALFEMMYVDDVPISVSINEAVELAKIFGGGDDSPRFVNGVLGNIARQMEE